jgi:Raf kinase inhibitor-like YbhB/YbcL family protein
MRGLVVLLVGCGASSHAADAFEVATFPLTSAALADNAAFDAANTCDGADTSPVLAWSGAPASTQSYAVVLLDNSISLVHWVIYDVPPTVTGLPADVEKAYAPGNVAGAHQTPSFQATTIGYLGPCPPTRHTYQFTVYALDVPTLPAASMTTAGGDALASIDEHRIATGMLTGTYQRP